MVQGWPTGERKLILQDDILTRFHDILHRAIGRSYADFSAPPSFSKTKRHKTDPHGGAGNWKQRRHFLHFSLSESALADEKVDSSSLPPAMGLAPLIQTAQLYRCKKLYLRFCFPTSGFLKQMKREETDLPDETNVYPECTVLPSEWLIQSNLLYSHLLQEFIWIRIRALIDFQHL
jgi:hypothetical protein